MTTSATVSSNVNCTSATEARMVWVRSEMIETFTAGGIDASKHRQHRFDPVDGLDDVGAGLALDARMMARCWLYQPATRSFSGALMAWPMSLMRTGEPLR